MARKSKKKTFKKHVAFTGRIVMIGFGSIGQGVLPLILRHIDIEPEPDHHHHRRGSRRPEGADELRHHVHQEAR